MPLPKVADPHYQSKEHEEWALKIKRRAGWRCEVVEHNRRCPNAAPEHRMYADHIDELKDGGDALGAGMCVCASHHTKKTIAERNRRMTAPLPNSPMT